MEEKEDTEKKKLQGLDEEKKELQGLNELANLEKKLEEKKKNGEPITSDMVQCPSNMSWLRSMYNMLPREVFRSSRLSKYEGCIQE